MSTLPPKAEALPQSWNVRKVPQAEVSGTIGGNAKIVSQTLVCFCRHEFERFCRLEFTRSVPGEDPTARHGQLLDLSALREVQIGQWNPEGIGASCGVEEQDLVLLVPNGAPECR
jgi:hypothetical protein